MRITQIAMASPFHTSYPSWVLKSKLAMARRGNSSFDDDDDDDEVEEIEDKDEEVEVEEAGKEDEVGWLDKGA
jgi:hypothetical protein